MFDNVRAFIRSDWLRRAFIIFIVAAVIGLVASVYFHFAGQRPIPQLGNLFNKEGVIGGGAVNVNLRSEPNTKSEVLKWLPQGTKVRVLEDREGWARVKVTDLPSGTVSDGVDTGWVLGRYIQFN